MQEKNLEKFIKRLDLNEGISQKNIKDIEKQLNVFFPEDYIEFIIKHNGAEGFVGDGSYLMLWSIDKLIKNNKENEVKKYAPALILFGSSGGGEAFGFDRRLEKISYVRIPFIPLDWKEAIHCGNTFYEFLEYLYKWK